MQLAVRTYTKGRGWSDPPPVIRDPRRTLILVFGASQFGVEPTVIESLLAGYPGAAALGCSTAGEILNATILDESIVVAFAEFAHTDLVVASAPVPKGADSFAAGQALAKAIDRPDLKAVLVLSDGLTVNGSELVRGLNAILPKSVVTTGGLAGDGSRFERTWVIEDGRVRSGAVTAVGLVGDRVQVGHGSRGGWDIFGPERRVTKSRGNELFELDGKPALELYKSYLGDRAAGLPATGLLFPLALRSAHGDARQLVRTILAVDEGRQSMTFAGDIPEGWLAQLMSANFDRLIEGASDAALATRWAGPTRSATLAIAISCVGRRLVLGERAEEEVEATHEVFPADSIQVGFYSYGEISPFATGACDLHNQTMTLTTITEG